MKITMNDGWSIRRTDHYSLWMIWLIIHSFFSLFVVQRFSSLSNDRDNTSLLDRFKGRLTRLRKSIRPRSSYSSTDTLSPARFSRVLCTTWLYTPAWLARAKRRCICLCISGAPIIFFLFLRGGGRRDYKRYWLSIIFDWNYLLFLPWRNLLDFWSPL